MVKTEARILGIDDSPFNKFKDKRTLLIGTFFRGGSSLDGVLTTAVKVDGSDSTEKIISMVKKSKFRPQLQAIMLNGIAVGGFNVIDIRKLATKTKIPVIVVMRNYPEAGRMAAALAKLHEAESQAGGEGRQDSQGRQGLCAVQRLRPGNRDGAAQDILHPLAHTRTD